jgi:hypothetical protein
MTDDLVKRFERAAKEAKGGHSWHMGRSPKIRYNEETGEEYWTTQELAELRTSNSSLTAILELVEFAPKILEHIRALESELATAKSALATAHNDAVEKATSRRKSGDFSCLVHD